jgi:hypothetical protein
MTPSALTLASDQVRQSPIEAHHFEHLQNAGPSGAANLLSL